MWSSPASSHRLLSSFLLLFLHFFTVNATLVIELIFIFNLNCVSEYVQKYATEAALREQENLQSSSDNESSLSDFSEDETQEMEL